MTAELRDIAAAIGAAQPTGSRSITGWSVDSRTVQPGDLFFALEGDSHDGHLYVNDVLAQGAAGAVVSRPVGTDDSVLLVPDTLTALQDAARWARTRFTGTMIGVTGSAGKTTTKDVIAALLSTAFTVGATVGNFNNHVGLPLSLLRLPDDAQVAVLELGMNHAGEIRDLAQIAKPSIAVVTNVGHAHIENFRDVHGIAAAKRELVEALPESGVAILNADDPLVAPMSAVHPGSTITFGLQPHANVRAENVQYSGEGVCFIVNGIAFETPMLGRPAVLNLLAGIATARVLGLDPSTLTETVRSIRPGKMRGERTIHDGVTLWNDSYNANPDAMKAMLEVLVQTPATHHIAVLGEMRELGREGARLHHDVGVSAAQAGVWMVVGVTGEAREIVRGATEAGLDPERAIFFEEPAAAGRFLRGVAQKGDAILWKGSRGTRVELALEAYLH